MKPHITTLITLFFTFFILAQNIIKDSNTDFPVSFVNIQVINKDVGATADENGQFKLPKLTENDSILFTAIGYKNLKIAYNSLPKNIYLNAIENKLNDVVTTPRKNNKEYRTAKLKKRNLNFSYSTNYKSSWILAKYFPYNEAYKNTRYIKTIQCITRSRINNATFNIRIYSVDDEGKPEVYLSEDNIIGIAKKGKNITEIDVSDLNIRIPEEGFFIAYEWLIVDSNKHDYKVTNSETNKEYIRTSYQPNLIMNKLENIGNGWIFHKAEWKKQTKKLKLLYSTKYKGKYPEPAIELVLTN